MPDEGFITLNISVTGTQQLTRKIQTFGTKISDLTPAWERIAEDFRQDFREQFSTEGAFIAKKMAWAPLRPSTVRDRISKGYFGEHPILYRTGRLMRSFTDKNSPGNITYITPTELSIGSNYWTAAWMHFGTPKVVSRPIAGLSWKRRSGIVDRIREFVDEQIKAAGLN